MRKVWKPPTLTTAFSAWSGGQLEYRRPKKPTDLWGVFPTSMPWPDARAWEKAPRGTRQGIQGMDADERGIIPWGLSYTLCIHTEEEISRGNSPDKNSDDGGWLRSGTMEKILRFLPFMRNHALITT